MNIRTEAIVATILIVILLIDHSSSLSMSRNGSNNVKISKSMKNTDDVRNNECEAKDSRRHEENDEEDTAGDEIQENEANDCDGNYGSPKKVETEIAVDRDARRQVRKTGRQPKVWDQWGKWSCCSASCGPGQLVRWRHCIGGGCASGEKEAQIRSCHLKNC